MRKTFLVVLVCFSAIVSLAQNGEEEGPRNPNFKPEELPRLLLREINAFRKKNGVDSLQMNEMLSYAADLSSYEKADDGKDKVEPRSTQKYLKKAGATKRGEELALKIATSKGKEGFTTAEVAKNIASKWESNKKNLPVLLNPKYTQAGITGHLDADEKKVFTSLMLAGYDISNPGAEYKGELAVPYNTKSRKLKPPDNKSCKSCDRWRNYDVLHKGLYVADGKVYLRYPHARELKRLLKKSTDGLAFDIVQRQQYENEAVNIIDYNLYNKGVMGKVIYKEKFFAKNRLVNPKDKKSKKIKGIEVELGKFEKKITGPYEINLIVIQDKRVCKTITRGYYETGKIESSTPIGLLPARGTSGLKPPFEPKNETSIISFMIPFEKNKYEFRDEDIQPFIKALREPDFIIDGLYIYAYSSIEGDSAANAKLQRKRAESVLNILQSQQTKKITPSIETKDSWGLFLLENEDGKYKYLVEMGKRKAIEKINGDRQLLEELEPILAKERFAQIIMDITYDVKGEKEKHFTQVSFERALKGKNPALVHKIMEFAGRRVQENKYPVEMLDSLKFEEIPANAALINNKVYYRYQASTLIEEEDKEVFEKLLQWEPANPVYQYNKIFCEIKLDSNAGDPAHREQVQQTIDGLYSQLDSSLVNGLNIEWQFKIIESADTSDKADEIVDACITRIKSFYNIKDAGWQNALKLSYVFSRAKDFRQSATLLEPYLDKPEVSENLIFFYIASASRVAEKYYSRSFAKALEIAKDRNKERYCKLFGEPYMSFQVLENPDVKKTYISNCPKQ